MRELQFVANSIATAQHRTGPDGRDYLVAPGTIIVEGVLGNELLLASEFGRHAQGWAGRPLPLLHPRDGDHYVSANSPDLLESVSVGYFYNPRVTGNKLQGEYWIDVEKARRLGGDAAELLTRLEANQKIETSTAYFRDFDPTPGTWNGKQYAGIARNIVPDHVAVLVNEIGNCSIADGCGLLANSCGCGKCSSVQTNEDVAAEAKTGIMVAFRIPADVAESLAAMEWPEGSDPITVDDMHITLAYLGKVGETNADELEVLRRLTEIAKDTPVLRARIGGIGRFSKNNGEKQAVWAQVDSQMLGRWRGWLADMLGYTMPPDEHSYTPHITLAYVPADTPVSLLAPPEQEFTLDSLALSWGDRTTVFPLQGEVLSSNSFMEALNMSKDTEVEVPAVDVPKVPAAQDKGKPEGEPKKDDSAIMAVNAQVTELAGQVETLTKFISDMGGVEKIRETLQLANMNAQAMAANAQREKDGLIAGLLTNARCEFDKEDLEKMDIAQLGKLSRSLMQVDYSGRGVAANRRQQAADDLVLLEMPDPLKKETS